jgi:hypothetical protein
MEVKVTGSSVTLQTTYKTAQRYNPKMHTILLTEPSDKTQSDIMELHIHTSQQKNS